ncbi:hypothetical protein PVAP13_8NG114401 [Panicum virgatum]|uniref:Uncharacterized protein n=1 Tax=Panicum virgatum TaxID=38727 RepID=A0A8T0PBE6_PANVG|nr:hypothetical protein PVAP13_8NG114401 [Panicum virgatum]
MTRSSSSCDTPGALWQARLLQGHACACRRHMSAYTTERWRRENLCQRSQQLALVGREEGGGGVRAPVSGPLQKQVKAGRRLRAGPAAWPRREAHVGRLFVWVGAGRFLSAAGRHRWQQLGIAIYRARDISPTHRLKRPMLGVRVARGRLLTTGHRGRAGGGRPARQRRRTQGRRGRRRGRHRSGGGRWRLGRSRGGGFDGNGSGGGRRRRWEGGRRERARVPPKLRAGRLARSSGGTLARPRRWGGGGAGQRRREMKVEEEDEEGGVRAAGFRRWFHEPSAEAMASSARSSLSGLCSNNSGGNWQMYWLAQCY